MLWANLADTHKFIVIYQNSTNSADECWDVASSKTISCDGGGDSQSIASMMLYTVSKYNVDTSKVFVTCVSSSAMMTNVMVDVYPNLFTAASAYSGLGAECFADPSVDY